MPPPDRWGDYRPLGAVIEGTRILCCKVPLKHALVRSLPEEERFTPEILINKVWEMGHGLGLLVDLTFTKKYYSSAELTDKGVLYHKIFTKGHDVPSNNVYGRFAHILNTYIEKNKTNTSVIGVHCTHGVNRTGYLVCRYLIEYYNMRPDDAINAFNTARGHDLERDNYIYDLKRRKPGVKTRFDPSTFNEDEEEEAPYYVKKKIPNSPDQVENSYSKLLDLHKPGSFSDWFRQRERDKMIRNERRSTEETSEWREEDTRGYSGEYSGGRYGRQWSRDEYVPPERGRRSRDEDQIGAGYGPRGGYQSNRGRSSYGQHSSRGNRSYNMRRGEDFSQDDPYDGFSAGGGYKQNDYKGKRYGDRYDQSDHGNDQSYGYDGTDQTYDGNDQNYGYDSTDQTYDGNDQNYGYDSTYQAYDGNNQNYGYDGTDQTSGYDGTNQTYGNKQNYGYAGNNKNYGYDGNDQNYGYDGNEKSSGYDGNDQSSGYDDGYRQDHRRAMRYEDWSDDRSEQYTRSGWQSNRRERDGRRPNRQGQRW